MLLAAVGQFPDALLRNIIDDCVARVSVFVGVDANARDFGWGTMIVFHFRRLVVKSSARSVLQALSFSLNLTLVSRNYFIDYMSFAHLFCF